MQILHIGKTIFGFLFQRRFRLNFTKMVQSVMQRALCPRQHQRVRSCTSPNLLGLRPLPLPTYYLHYFLPAFTLFTIKKVVVTDLNKILSVSHS